jgi:hypothetical protein
MIGVAVTSQILCISITLNKGNVYNIQFEISNSNLTPFHIYVNPFIDILLKSYYTLVIWVYYSYEREEYYAKAITKRT